MYMTSVQYMPRRDKTEIILSLFDEEWELLEDHCCTSISEGLGNIVFNVRYNVFMTYLVGLIHVEQRNFFLPEQVCIYQVFIYMLSWVQI